MSAILVVDDDVELCDIIALSLRLSHDLEIAHDGATALEKLQARQFDAVILDWELPDMSGIELAQAVRGERNLTPIIMLTARKSIEDKVSGLDSGIDDYLTKPFQMKELEARLRVLMKPHGKAASRKHDVIQVKDLVLRRAQHVVEYCGEPIELASREFDLLELLMDNPERVFTQEALSQKLWDGNATIDTIRACMKRLRQKLGKAADMIHTNIGVGYSLSGK